MIKIANIVSNRGKQKINSHNMLSVIIPTLNEEKIIANCLSQFFQEKDGETNSDFEVIVVDGGSTDRTKEIVRNYSGIKFIETNCGRAKQMNEGARIAKGEVLLFLHADTILPLNWLEKIREVFGNSRYIGGAFGLKIDSSNILLKIVSITANFRSRFTMIPYGDQAIFIERKYFEKIGGYREIPLMEDVDLMKRIKKSGKRIYLIKEKVKTSPRKWIKEGIIFTTLRNHLIRILYLLGVSSVKLAKLYYRQEEIK